MPDAQARDARDTATRARATGRTGYVGVCLWLFGACFVVGFGGAYGVAMQLLGHGGAA